MSEGKSVKVKLDWTRLLGFDQADQSRESTPSTTDESRQIKAGPKFGLKPGVKPGVKVGVKVGVKFGQKAGLKLAL